jgi:hypothetical protein
MSKNYSLAFRGSQFEAAMRAISKYYRRQDVEKTILNRYGEVVPQMGLKPSLTASTRNDPATTCPNSLKFES